VEQQDGRSAGTTGLPVEYFEAVNGYPPVSEGPVMTKTVIQHVLSRLHDLGVTDVFGVPGDYAFAINDAICNDPRIRWVGCCNELNAAYAADGYAHQRRRRGVLDPRGRRAERDQRHRL
jgi:hypothetical protein